MLKQSRRFATKEAPGMCAQSNDTFNDIVASNEFFSSPFLM